ncbi:hypothetical protein LQ564_00820 [Massilia sp. G4R7]|uniref:DUF6968 domain-containing protein n=1 Tax=Massilia phyllostachyos TaxID=2898585 RepID=A0ABS8PZB5_9BURK|nr:hypothetical protein [Massilia phyllostachyos]MCD2514851.1 hypothetical protein [Massilia phyllostachyos]
MIKTPIDNPIAQQHYILVRPDGSEVTVMARIGQPYLEEATHWRCPAALEGIDGQYPDIYGEGSMQPLGLALRLIRTRLLATIEDGGILYYPDDRSTAVDAETINVVFAG